MTEPQVWALIGVFGAVFFSMLGVQTASINRGIGALRESMDARIDGFKGEVSARFGEVNARFDAMTAKIEALDRDVQVLSRRVFDADGK